MRHGIVSDGRSTTYYGNAASNFMAQQTALYCLDQAEAERAVSSATGAFRDALIYSLGQRGFTMPEALLEKLKAEDQVRAEEAAALGVQRLKDYLKDRPKKTAKRNLAALCTFCAKPISASHDYFEGKGKKAHASCLR